MCQLISTIHTVKICTFLILKRDLNLKNEIGTPTFFINGYQLPGQYDIGDIKYFSEIFEGKEMIKV